MKEIKMELEEYINDTQEKYDEGFESGIEDGISYVMKWLESKERLYEFLVKTHYISEENWKSIHEKLHWARIAKALGRENELFPKDIKKEVK